MLLKQLLEFGPVGFAVLRPDRRQTIGGLSHGLSDGDANVFETKIYAEHEAVLH